jgi:choline dehydrogenase-like flavoprotein
MRPHVAADPNPVSQTFLAAAKEVGYPATDDFNGEVQEGAGWHELSIDGGRRQSTAVAYLHPAEHRPNLTVRTGALARRLTFDGKRCTGVEYERGGSVERVTAEAEMIVCGGTVNSPQLLLLSGVGPAGHLREVGIDVVHDLPGVGENLHDHPLLSLVFEAQRAIPSGKNQHRGGVYGLAQRSVAARPRHAIPVHTLPVPPAVHAGPAERLHGRDRHGSGQPRLAPAGQRRSHGATTDQPQLPRRRLRCPAAPARRAPSP